MVQWKNYNVENATWEPKDNVIASFEEEQRIKVQSLDSMAISEYSGTELIARQTTGKSVLKRNGTAYCDDLLSRQIFRKSNFS